MTDYGRSPADWKSPEIRKIEALERIASALEKMTGETQAPKVEYREFNPDARWEEDNF